MRRITLLAFAVSICLGCCRGNVYDITSFGARIGGENNAPAINKAIEECHRRGGGTVVVPEGTFVTGTVLLKGGVTLHLDAGATLKATEDLTAYQSMTSSEDLSRYDSGDGTQNSNNSKDTRWNRALVLAIGGENIAIEGEGTIDGGHVFDPEGEEHMRGPHTILFCGTHGFSLKGISIIRAANYAFMAYDVTDGTFSNVKIDEGWDGIHIRGGKNIDVSGCAFRTGDDAIAGGYWEGMSIRGCDINSSCNGIRIIMPVSGVAIDSCRFHGPGEFPHRTSGERRRCNMLAALNIQPGGWGKAYGNVDSVTVKDVVVENVATPLMVTLNEGNDCGSISVENLTATGVYGAPISIESWKGGIYNSISLKDVSVEYVGADDPSLARLPVGQPPADFRPLPCWGLFAKDVKTLEMENVALAYTGKEFRPALRFDNVGKALLEGVKYPGR
ncbi:MAG: right-handed parallel beta-helix repeat-containing protein [Bacteroidales bacterium]|nr:right-handed parallel beta-helix repeat-containing protein [Bacteroidales bacterium]